MTSEEAIEISKKQFLANFNPRTIFDGAISQIRHSGSTLEKEIGNCVKNPLLKAYFTFVGTETNNMKTFCDGIIAEINGFEDRKKLERENRTKERTKMIGDLSKMNFDLVSYSGLLNIIGIVRGDSGEPKYDIKVKQQ